MGLLTASAIGTFVGCPAPADLAMIRKQANATLHYKHTFHADEGIFAYWKGAVPTVARSMALELGIIAVYYPSVKFFKDCGLASSAYFAADVASTSVAVICSAPSDYVKTQMQIMKPDAFGKYPYTGPIDCAKKILKSSGPRQFYSGIGSYIFRSSPQTALMVAILRDLRKVEKQN